MDFVDLLDISVFTFRIHGKHNLLTQEKTFLEMVVIVDPIKELCFIELSE
jgi:hypothetical protein